MRWLVVLATSLALGGCKKANPDYCCTGADCAEQRQCPDDLFCDNEGAFGDLEHSCVEPPGTPCSESNPCDGEAPVCHDGLCVECEEAEDCTAAQPVCSGELTCDGCAGNDDCALHAEATPVCGDDGACRACAGGDECTSGVCDTEVGGCVAADDVLYVEEGADGADCTAEAPCGAIQQAVALAEGDRVWILVAEGSYAGTVTLDDVTVRIIGYGADLIPTSLMSGLVVRGGADVLVEGLRIHDATGTGSGGDGINCANDVDSPILRVRRATIEGNDDEGIEALACTVELTRSVLRGNVGGALTVEDSDFTIINNFVYENGGVDEPGGVSVRGNPPGGETAARIEHNTVVRNIGPDGVVSGVTCSEVVTELTFRNNIVWGNNATASSQVLGATCAHRFSLIGPQEVSGEGNLNVAPTYIDQGSDDYRLEDGSTGIDTAADSDVLVDHEGDARPAGDGPDMGADERAP